MFSFSNDRWLLGAATLCMLVLAVFAAVDGILARCNHAMASMPDDESRMVMVGAAALGFLLGAFRIPGE